MVFNSTYKLNIYVRERVCVFGMNKNGHLLKHCFL